ncbi:MAG: hypothetical protein QF639_04355 [Rhodospirillales bacterium]|nr:hypothetical protein [Rhodospirillales bacterium]MDP7241975.1 hypothetical protein [Rhodospirillales bacterium]HJO72613.1 hypothetical protein [Rhodospirillales bacterium]
MAEQRALVIFPSLVSSIVDVFGRVVEEIRSPRAGPVVRIATFPIVGEGERVVQLGAER